MAPRMAVPSIGQAPQTGRSKIWLRPPSWMKALHQVAGPSGSSPNSPPPLLNPSGQAIRFSSQPAPAFKKTPVHHCFSFTTFPTTSGCRRPIYVEMNTGCAFFPEQFLSVETSGKAKAVASRGFHLDRPAARQSTSPFRSPFLTCPKECLLARL